MFAFFLTALTASITLQSPAPAKKSLPPLFTTQTFEAARIESQKNSQPILLYFSEAGNKQCANFAEFTWTDANLREWIGRNVIPVEVDIAADVELARRYHAVAAPTLVVVLPDGKSSREIVGFRGPDLLLRLLEARLVDPVAAAKKAVERAGSSAAARLTYARALQEDQRYPEALEQYLMCIDGPAAGAPTEVGSRMLAVEAFAPLIIVHPAAADALKERRDQLREAVKDGKASAQQATLYAAMNAQLGDVDDTMSVYSDLKSTAPNALITRLLRDALVESLVSVRRYGEALSIMDPVKHFGFALEQQESDERRAAPMSSQEQEIRFRIFLRDQFIDRTIRYYELLLGGGRPDDAAKVAEQMTAAHPSAHTYQQLAAAGLRAGSANDLTLVQARKALELAGARANFAILSTLVKALKSAGRDDEAAAIVATYADRLSDVEEAESLRRMTSPSLPG